MVKLTDFLQKILIKVPVYTLLLPLFIRPLTQAKNVVFAKQRPTDEPYQDTGLELYRMAQVLDNSNATFYRRLTVQQIRIQNVAQAALAGLYVSHTLSPPLTIGEGPAYHTNHAADNISLILDSPMYTPDKNESAANPLPYFTSKQHQSMTDTGLFAPCLIVALTRTKANRRANFPKKPRRNPPPRIKLQSNNGSGAVNSVGANKPGKYSADGRSAKTAVNPERRFSGKVAEQAEVQLTGANEQPGVQSAKPQVRNRLKGPGGSVPAAPSLADFIETSEVSHQELPAPDGSVPAAPSIKDFIVQPPINNAEQGSAIAIAPDAIATARLPLSGTHNIEPQSPMPAEMTHATATRLAAGLVEKAVDGALSAGGTRLGSGLSAIGGALFISSMGVAETAPRSSNQQPEMTGQVNPYSTLGDDRLAMAVNPGVKEVDARVMEPATHVIAPENRAGPSVVGKAALDAETLVEVELDLPTSRPMQTTVEGLAPLATPEADFAIEALDISPLQQQIVDQCEITLTANQYGFWVDNLNPEYYDRQAIYEVREIGADISEPVFRRYILMAGKRVAVRWAVVPTHGVKYEIYDESNPAKSYALTVSLGRWQLQELTSLQLTEPLIQAITPDLIDRDCLAVTLSVPDDRGLQWSHDNKSYLRIKGYYMRVFQDENSINRYCIEAPDKSHGINIYYHKSRFWLTAENSGHINIKARIKNRKKFTHRELIYNNMRLAYLHMKNNNAIKCFEKIKAALELHVKIEAGSINQISILTLDFLEHFLHFYGREELQGAEKITIQNAWVKNIRLPLLNNIQIKPKRINKFFYNVPLLLKNLIDYVLEETLKSILIKFQSCILSISTEPMPQYSFNSKKKRFHYLVDGSTVLTNISIYGNDYFIRRVTFILNDIIKINLGKKIIDALKDKFFTIHPPTMNAIEREKKGKFYAKNSAGGSIAFDPDNKIIGRENTVPNEPWRKREPAVALYHELLHIYYKYHSVTFNSIDGKIKQKIVGGHSEVDEGLIVGISVYKEKTASLFAFGDKAYLAKYHCEAISENDFRKQYAMTHHKDYFVRPYYVKRNSRIRFKNIQSSLPKNV